MGSEWPIVRLGDYVESSLGKMLDAKKNKGELQPYLGNSNVRWGQFELSNLAEMRFEEHEQERYQLLPGDLVVCEGGEPGRCAIWRGQVPDMKIQKALHRVRAKPGMKNEYLYYWLTLAARLGTLEPYFTGTTIKHLTGRALAELPVPLPPMEVQESIVAVLGKVDERIDCLGQTNAILEAIAQALFKSWFVDFDPVRAKAEGRVPEGMDAVTAALFPSEFEDSELGPIPKGWRCRPLGDALEVQIGGAWGEEAESAKASVNVSCMRGIDAVEIGAGRKPDVPKRWITPKQIAARALREGDILVEGSGSFCGRSLYWIESYADLLPLTPVYSNFVKRLASPQGREVSYWASQHLAQVFHSGEIVNYRTGSAFPNLDTAGLLLKNIATPDTAKIATSLYELVQPLLETKKQNIDRAATLADLRDTLLPRLISGKLRLPEAEREVEAATA